MSTTVTCPLLSCPGNGYCRSEAAVAVLLTKRTVAKRVYATVVNAGNNTDGYKEQGEDASAVGVEEMDEREHELAAGIYVPGYQNKSILVICGPSACRAGASKQASGGFIRYGGLG